MQMGLFDRKAKVRTAASPEPPPVLSAGDLAAAVRMVDRWDAALGDNDAVWACIDTIARMGGFRGVEASLRETVAGVRTEDTLNRPWRWWAEAARLANAQADHVLVGRIFLMTHLFVSRMLPSMNAAIQLDAGLGNPQQGTYQAIARSAVDSLGYLPPGMLIHDTPTGTVDAASARDMAMSVAMSLS